MATIALQFFREIIKKIEKMSWGKRFSIFSIIICPRGKRFFLYFSTGLRRLCTKKVFYSFLVL